MCVFVCAFIAIGKWRCQNSDDFRKHVQGSVKCLRQSSSNSSNDNKNSQVWLSHASHCHCKRRSHWPCLSGAHKRRTFAPWTIIISWGKSFQLCQNDGSPWNLSWTAAYSAIKLVNGCFLIRCPVGCCRQPSTNFAWLFFFLISFCYFAIVRHFAPGTNSGTTNTTMLANRLSYYQSLNNGIDRTAFLFADIRKFSALLFHVLDPISHGNLTTPDGFHLMPLSAEQQTRTKHERCLIILNLHRLQFSKYTPKCLISSFFRCCRRRVRFKWVASLRETLSTLLPA